MDNFSILYGGRLGNQLVLLYQIYNIFDSINNIYAPTFDQYSKYFNIEKLCNITYYENNKDTFFEAKWGELNSQIQNYNDLKFNDLKLKENYQIIVNNIIQDIEHYNLISVHIRQTDFKFFHDGKFYFSYEKYIQTCIEKIEEWGVKNYKILIFSDQNQNINNDFIKVSDLTNFEAPLDLFLMSECNYFISTWSTFSIMAMNLSKSSGKFKNNYIIEI